VYGLAVNSRQDEVLAADTRGQARVLGIRDGSPRCTLSGSGGLKAAAFDATGERMAVAGYDGTVMLARHEDCWNGAPVDPAKVMVLRAGRGRISSVAIRENEVLLGDGTGRVSAWSMDTWQMKWMQSVHQGEVKSLAVNSSTSDRPWASAGIDHVVTLEGMPLGKVPGIPYGLQGANLPEAFWVVDDEGFIMSVSSRHEPIVIQQDEGPLYALTTIQLEAASRTKKVSALIPVRGGATKKIRMTAHGLRADSKFDYQLDALLEYGSITALDTRAARPRLIVAQGTSNGDILIRDADDGRISHRLQPLKGQVNGLDLSSDYIWAGGADGRLVRYALGNPPYIDRDIAEGAPILGIAVSPDKRFLIAALEDGRAAVHVLPQGKLVAHLVPFADGSWATFHADGHYEVSATGAARNTLVELPGRRFVELDGDPLRLEILDIAQIPRYDGSTEVHATILSPRGRPTVWLDGNIEVPGITPSTTVARTYELSFSLNQAGGSMYRLEVRAPEVEPVSRELHVGHDPSRTRALLIANEDYQREPLEGPHKDATDLAAFFKDEVGLGLLADRVDVRKDRTRAALERDINDFFGSAAEGETLVFYYAGHGRSGTDEGQIEGFLVPVDHGAPGVGDVPASSLWQAIRKSRASEVLLILDACRSGAFMLPGDLMRAPLERAWRARTGPRVGVLAATSPSESTAGTRSGGLFTQTLVQVLRNPALADPRTGLFTVRLARNRLEDTDFSLTPALYGALDGMVLARPKREHLDSGGPVALPNGHNDWLGVSYEIQSTRQIAAEHKTLRSEDLLVLTVHYLHDTETLRVEFHEEGENSSAYTPHVHRIFGKAGTTATFKVSIGHLKKNRLYEVLVTPCVKNQCQDASRRRFPLSL